VNIYALVKAGVVKNIVLAADPASATQGDATLTAVLVAAGKVVSGGDTYDGVNFILAPFTFQDPGPPDAQAVAIQLAYANRASIAAQAGVKSVTLMNAARSFIQACAASLTSAAPTAVTAGINAI
jgi:hypothetical protein